MKTNQNNHQKRMNARRNTPNFAARLALALTLALLTLSPLASCKDSGNSAGFGKPEELFRQSWSNGTLAFKGMAGDWIYYETSDNQSPLQYGLWRMNKDGTGNVPLAWGSPGLFEHYDFNYRLGRIYYSTSNQIRSSLPDLSDTMVLLELTDSECSQLRISGDWIYFVRWFMSPVLDNRPRSLCGLYRMRLDGSELSEIALGGESEIFANLIVEDSEAYYIRYFIDSFLGMHIAKSNAGQETELTSEVYGELSSFCHSDGFLYYSCKYPESDECLLRSVDTREPYATKTIASEKDSNGFIVYFDALFVDGDWVYYQQTQMHDVDPIAPESGTDGLWRVRVDGSDKQLVLSGESFALFLAFDGSFVYYQTYSADGHETVVWRMKIQ